MRAHDVEALLGWSKELHTLTLSPDASRFAIGGGAKSARLYATEGELLAELPHFAAVGVLRFSPDGTRLASGSDDMGVRLFSADGDLLSLLKGHTHAISDLAWHPDNERLATAGIDGRLYVWAGTRRLETLDDLGAQPRSVAWLGERLVIGTASSVVLTGDARRAVACDFVRQVGVSPSGKSFAVMTSSWSEQRERVDVVTLYSLELEPIWRGPARAFAFDATGGLAIAEGSTLRLLEPDSAVERWAAQVHDGAIDCVCALTGAAWLTGGNDGSVRIVSATGRPSGAMSHTSAVSFCVSAGDQVVSVSRAGQCLAWKTSEAGPARAPSKRFEPIFREKLANGANAVAFSPDGRRVAVATEAGIELRDASSGERQELIAPGESAWGVEWSRGFLRTRLRNDDSVCRVWNGETLAHVLDIPHAIGFQFFLDRVALVNAGKNQLVYQAQNGDLKLLAEAPADSYGSSVSADARWVLFATHAGAILIDAESAEQERISERKIRRSSISPDGRLVIVSGDGRSEILDTRSGKELVPLDVPTLWSCAWSPKGDRFAAGDSNGCLHLFDNNVTRITRAEPVRLVGHDLPMFFPDGSRFTTGGRHGGKASIWRATDGERIAELGGLATGFIKAVVVANGTRILTHANVSPAEDLSLRLWDADGGNIAALPGHEGRSFWQVNISPCGRFAVSVVRGDRPRVWSLETGELVAALDGHGREIRAAQFAPAVEGPVTLATADGEGTFQLWRL